MPRYVGYGHAVEAKRLFCTFLDRPFISTESVDDVPDRSKTSIKGNPATAMVDRIWEYKES